MESAAGQEQDVLRIVETGDDVILPRRQPEVNVMVFDANADDDDDDDERRRGGQIIEIVAPSSPSPTPRDDDIALTATEMPTTESAAAAAAAASLARGDVQPAAVGGASLTTTLTTGERRLPLEESLVTSPAMVNVTACTNDDDDVFSNFPSGSGSVSVKPPSSFAGLVSDVLPCPAGKQPPQSPDRSTNGHEPSETKDEPTAGVRIPSAGDNRWTVGQPVPAPPPAVARGHRPVIDLSWSSVSDWWCGWFDAAWLPYTLLAVLMTWVAAATAAEPALVILVVMFATLLFLCVCPPPPPPSSSSQALTPEQLSRI